MTIPFIPAEIETPPLVDGYSSADEDGRVRTQPDHAPPLTRGGQSSLGGRPVAAATIVTVGGLMRFRRWWKEEINNGRGLFIARDFATDGCLVTDDADHPILNEDDAPWVNTSLFLCRFQQDVSTPPWTPFGLDWQINWNLVVID